jgi:hypothetical protein
MEKKGKGSYEGWRIKGIMTGKERGDEEGRD